MLILALVSSGAPQNLPNPFLGSPAPPGEDFLEYSTPPNYERTSIYSLMKILKSFLNPSFKRSKISLERTWSCLVAYLRSNALWASSLTSWGILDASWGRFGCILGPFWWFSGSLGASWELSGANATKCGLQLCCVICPTDEHHRSAPQMCLANAPHKCLRKCAPKMSPANVPHKCAPPMCPENVPRKWAPKGCPAYVPHKFALEMCPTNVPR